MFQQRELDEAESAERAFQQVNFFAWFLQLLNRGGDVCV
jgi:hypothetical protein